MSHCGGAKLQDSGHAKLPSVVTYLLSSDVTSAGSVVAHFFWLWQLPSPVSRGCHSLVTCERVVLLHDI